MTHICVTKLGQHWFIIFLNFSKHFRKCNKLDESTARRYLKSPRSLSGRSLNLTLVTKWSRSWSWITYSNPLCSMSISPPILRYSYPWSKPRVWSKVKVRFDLENSKVKVMVKVRPINHIWGLGWVQFISLLFISWQSNHFGCDSKFHIWPWKFKVKITTKIDQNLIR